MIGDLVQVLLALYLLAALLSLAHVLIFPAGFFRVAVRFPWRHSR